MPEVMKSEKGGRSWIDHRSGGSVKIEPLLRDLHNPDGIIREKARETLVALGSVATDALLPLLKDTNVQVRWEAAKTLAEIADPQAAPFLVGVLEDKDFGVRWLAAQGLIAVGIESLPPLLDALIQRSASGWLRGGAHHVLHDLSKMGYQAFVGSVLSALDSAEPEVAVLEPARQALDAVKQITARQSGESNP